MEIKPASATIQVAVKHFKFTAVEPHQLLVVSYNPSLPLEVVAFNTAAVVLKYNNDFKIVVVQSPAAADCGRLTSDVRNTFSSSIWWEAPGRTDLVFMNALSEADDLTFVRAQYPRQFHLKSPPQMQVTGYSETDIQAGIDAPSANILEIRTEQEE
jgi:hypothetical protein